jgi:hypothetical protein
MITLYGNADRSIGAAIVVIDQIGDAAGAAHHPRQIVPIIIAELEVLSAD